MKIIKLKAGQSAEDYVPPPRSAPGKGARLTESNEVIVRSKQSEHSAVRETQLTEFFIIFDYEQEWRFNTREEAIIYSDRIFVNDYGPSILELQHFKRIDYTYDVANSRKETVKEFRMSNMEELIRPVRLKKQKKGNKGVRRMIT